MGRTDRECLGESAAICPAYNAGDNGEFKKSEVTEWDGMSRAEGHLNSLLRLKV